MPVVRAYGAVVPWHGARCALVVPMVAGARVLPCRGAHAVLLLPVALALPPYCSALRSAALTRGSVSHSALHSTPHTASVVPPRGASAPRSDSLQLACDRVPTLVRAASSFQLAPEAVSNSRSWFPTPSFQLPPRPGGRRGRSVYRVDSASVPARAPARAPACARAVCGVSVEYLRYICGVCVCVCARGVRLLGGGVGGWGRWDPTLYRIQWLLHLQHPERAQPNHHSNMRSTRQAEQRPKTASCWPLSQTSGPQQKPAAFEHIAFRRLTHRGTNSLRRTYQVRQIMIKFGTLLTLAQKESLQIIMRLVCAAPGYRPKSACSRLSTTGLLFNFSSRSTPPNNTLLLGKHPYTCGVNNYKPSVPKGVKQLTLIS